MPTGSAAQASRKAVVRVLKTLMPVSLVREMDQLILALGGVYSGRDEFVVEALRDRIAEEKARLAGEESPTLVVLPTALEREAPPFASWSDTKVPTLPATTTDERLYGLHNRDYPTLWSVDRLARSVAEAGEPIDWKEFVTRTVEEVWSLAANLARADTERRRGEIKAALGFPANADKRTGAESRFVEHMMGVIRERPRGPFFVYALVGVINGASGVRVAPTDAALELLIALGRAGITPRPPHPDAAWSAFAKHLRTSARNDFATWMRVLRVAVERPTRDEVQRAFAEEWPGSAAETNVYGYISRGREWGLMEPQLIEGRYKLTPRGAQQLAEVRG